MSMVQHLVAGFASLVTGIVHGAAGRATTWGRPYGPCVGAAGGRSPPLHQLDLQALADGEGGALHGVQGDGRVGGIEQAVELGAARLHAADRRAGAGRPYGRTFFMARSICQARTRFTACSVADSSRPSSARKSSNEEPMLPLLRFQELGIRQRTRCDAERR